MQLSAKSNELHGKNSMSKALISSSAINIDELFSSAINIININKWSIIFSNKNSLQITSFLIEYFTRKKSVTPKKTTSIL